MHKLYFPPSLLHCFLLLAIFSLVGLNDLATNVETYREMMEKADKLAPEHSSANTNYIPQAFIRSFISCYASLSWTDKIRCMHVLAHGLGVNEEAVVAAAKRLVENVDASDSHLSSRMRHVEALKVALTPFHNKVIITAGSSFAFMS